MPTAKDIYFSKSEINLKKKVYLQRKYEVPGDSGVVYQEYSSIVASRWAIYNSATGVTISNGNIVFQNTSAGGGIVGSFNTTINTNIKLLKVEIEIDSYVSGTLLIKFYDALDTAPVRFSRDLNQNNKWYAIIACPSVISDGRFVIYSNDAFTGTITSGGAKGAKLYEDNWVDISQYLIDKSFSTSQVLDTESWEFGEVQQDNMKLSFVNTNGKLSDESNVNSLFSNGYMKHQSKIKVEVILDSYANTIFEGLIDERACSADTEGTALIKEKITIFSYMKLFSDLTIGALGSSTTSLMTTIQTAIQYIVNYGFFKYFVPESIISVANDAYIDITQYTVDTKLSEILQDLAKGQNAYWIDSSNVFHFSPVLSSSDNVYDFGLFPERKIKIYDYSVGADRVIENFYWKDSNTIKFISEKQKYATSETIDIPCITSPVTRQSIVNTCGENFAQKRITCKLDIPLCPFIGIFDEIKVSNVRNLKAENSGVAKFIDKSFIVCGIKHSNNMTTLHLIEKFWDLKVFENLSTEKEDSPLETIFDEYPQHQGKYIITLSAEQGCSNNSYINQATGAQITVKCILSSTDKIKIVKIKGGALDNSHGGCGLALYINGILLAVAGGGSCNENNNIGLGGGGYYAGKGYTVDGYDYTGARTYINTSSSGIAVGGKNTGNNLSYGGLGYENTNEEWGKISYTYVNGTDYGEQTPAGNMGSGSVRLEYLGIETFIAMEYELLNGNTGVVTFDSYVEMKTYIDSHFLSNAGTSLKTVTVSGAPADLTVPDSCARLFQEHHTIVTVGDTGTPLTVNWIADVSTVTDMSYMFTGGVKFVNLSKFNSISCTNMEATFMQGGTAHNGNITGLNLINTSKVTNMRRMFMYYHGSSLDLSSFDTSKVETMESMFEDCYATSLDLSSFNTANVTNMYGMFNNMSKITSYTFGSGWDVRKVTDMRRMFQSNTALTILNLKGWDTAGLIQCSVMFLSCSALRTVYVSQNQFNITHVTNSSNMFNGCTNIRGAISYNSNKLDANYANYTTGYFTLAA